MARTSKLTPEVRQKVVDAVSAGMHIVRAAEYAGISEATFYRWMEEGDPDGDDDGPDLENINVADLRKIAVAQDVELPKKIRKEQIIMLLRDAGVSSRAHFREFREAVEMAERTCELRLIASLQTTMQPERDPATGKVTRLPNPNAVLTFMARRWPRTWSPTQNIELSGKDGAPIGVSVALEDALAKNVQAYLKGIDDAVTEPTKEQSM